MILMQANPLGQLEGVGPEIPHFLGPIGIRFTHLPFQGPKSLDF